MKKLMMMAVMFVASATAFAGDSDALKAILKAKTYAEAETLLKSSLDQLANAQEKAKAYNKLEELAFQTFKKEDDIRMTNQIMKKNDPFDRDVLVSSGINAMNAALECHKYDILPNEKGKVKPSFEKKSQDNLSYVRDALLFTGFDYINSESLSNDEKNQKVFNCLNAYVAGAENDLMKETQKVKDDANLGVAAFHAGRSAVQLAKFDRATELFKVGIRDTSKIVHDSCFDLLIYTMGQNLKNADDSLKYEKQLDDLYVEYPDNEQIFASLAAIYNAREDFDKLFAFADAHLAKNPSAVYPHVYKANTYQLQKKYDEAIAEWNLVPETTNNYVNFIYGRAVCKLFKANEFNDKNANTMGRLTPENEAKYKEMLNDALVDFEKTKELDPDQLIVKWGYLLKNVYTATGQQEKADAIF